MPTVFASDFNKFRQITATQAWSLFFTASNTEKVLGEGRSVGRYLTIALFAAIIAGILEVVLTA
ncbi:MAG: hypothetical protein IGQ88_06615 [Gloeomargaritaceae cyanobacterium C42_A2020_066]|nr:hypothetical protein [Gloeomargaritaceae cyanobacterium C42_A2020_066]